MMDLSSRGVELRFLTETDGVACLEVVTRQPLPRMVQHRYDDATRSYATHEVSPEDYAFGGMGLVCGPPSGSESASVGMRYAHVLATTGEHDAIQHRLHLGAGHPERAFLQRVVDKGRLRVRWEKEQFQKDDPNLTDEYLELLRGVLDNTVDIDDAAWERETRAIDLKDWGYDSKSDGPSASVSREAVAPDSAVPFYAKLSGELPPTGAPTLAGVDLPAGRPVGIFGPAFWVTDHHVAQPHVLAGDLADAFEQTGLWPVLITADTLSTVPGHGAADGIDDIDVHAYVAEQYAALIETIGDSPHELEPFADGFAGLAGATPWTAIQNPFASFSALPDHDGTEWLLALVPCNRPSETFRVIGNQSQEHDARVLSAIARSWEERFAAVPTALDGIAMWFGVGAPPESVDDAARLAAEICALGPFEMETELGAVRNLAALLQDEEAEHFGYGEITRAHWQLTLGES